jgi:hypothetical protein
MHHPPRHPCRQPSCPMRDRAPIPAPIVASPTHCLSHTHWHHSCLQCRGERSALLCTQRWATTRSASSTTSNDRRIAIVAEKVRPPHYMSIAVCVRVSAVQFYAHVPPACFVPLTPPTAYPLPLTVCCLPLTATVCRQLPAPDTYRLPPAACACAYRLCCICTAYRLHTSMYPFLRSRSVRDGRARRERRRLAPHRTQPRDRIRQSRGSRGRRGRSIHVGWCGPSGLSHPPV